MGERTTSDSPLCLKGDVSNVAKSNKICLPLIKYETYNLNSNFSFSAGVYYLRAQSSAQMKMVKILREMLHAESRDKEYLLEKLSYFTGGRKSHTKHPNHESVK